MTPEMTTEEMLAYLDGQLKRIDAEINAMCAGIAAKPPERAVSRNTALEELANFIAQRGRYIADMGKLKFGEATAADFPGYEMQRTMFNA